ncbi:MAG: MOSC domain-containing protein [Ilumatobacteraceae bacterium]
MGHRTTDELTAWMPHVLAAPHGEGALEMVVRRPTHDQREVLDAGVLDVAVGLVGDNWQERPSRDMPDGGPHPDKQLTIMNARAAAMVAGEREQWPLCGDQLYVDLDIGVDHLPPGTRLAIGEALVEVTEPPHTGCAKFTERFGLDAMRFVNSPDGRAARLRGANAKVVRGGEVRPGDLVTVVPADAPVAAVEAAAGEGQAQPPA